MRYLLEQKKAVVSPIKRYSRSLYCENIRTVLYSIQRISERLRGERDSRIIEEILDLALPNELFDIDGSSCDWMTPRLYVLKIEHIFKEMLRYSLISFQLMSNETPCRLPYRWHMNVEWEDSTHWRLVSWKYKVQLPYKDNVFIPQIPNVFGIETPNPTAVMLSSDYAKRRKVILRQGERLGQWQLFMKWNVIRSKRVDLNE